MKRELMDRASVERLLFNYSTITIVTAAERNGWWEHCTAPAPCTARRFRSQSPFPAAIANTAMETRNSSGAAASEAAKARRV